MNKRRPLAVLASLILLTLGACTSSDVSADGVDPAAGRASWLAKGGCRDLPGDELSSPAEQQDTVLTVRGGTGASPVQLRLADLDALPQVECTVMDRQAEGREVRFSGVLVSTLLEHTGTGSATVLHTVALNDYQVDVPVSDAREVPLLLATRLEGTPMSVAHYGPTRFVYPTTGFDLDPVVYEPRWVWQLSEITAA